jgi:hypothetical protein
VDDSFLMSGRLCSLPMISIAFEYLYSTSICVLKSSNVANYACIQFIQGKGWNDERKHTTISIEAIERISNLHHIIENHNLAAGLVAGIRPKLTAQKKKMNIRAIGLQDFIFSSEFLPTLWLGKRNRK